MLVVLLQEALGGGPVQLGWQAGSGEGWPRASYHLVWKYANILTTSKATLRHTNRMSALLGCLPLGTHSLLTELLLKFRHTEEYLVERPLSFLQSTSEKLYFGSYTFVSLC